jgi:poly(A) polymerase
MAILGIRPGPVVGRAYKHLLEVRLDAGPLDEDAARAALLRWWAEQPESGQPEAGQPGADGPR